MKTMMMMTWKMAMLPPISLSPTTPIKKLARRVRTIDRTMGSQKKPERQKGLTLGVAASSRLFKSGLPPALSILVDTSLLRPLRVFSIEVALSLVTSPVLTSKGRLSFMIAIGVRK